MTNTDIESIIILMDNNEDKPLSLEEQIIVLRGAAAKASDPDNKAWLEGIAASIEEAANPDEHRKDDGL